MVRVLYTLDLVKSIRESDKKRCYVEIPNLGISATWLAVHFGLVRVHLARLLIFNKVCFRFWRPLLGG